MKKILVADDSLTIQKVIRLALSNESYEIQAVSDGKDALERIALFRPHVVLIDVSLPSLSAFEVKRELNRSPEFRHTQFVLMSSAFEQVDEDQASEASFAGRLVKPFDPGNLREVLQSVLSSIPEDDLPVPPRKAASPPEERAGGSKISLAPPDPSLIPNVPDDDGEDEEEEELESHSFAEDRTIAIEPAAGAFSGNEPPRLSDDLWDTNRSAAQANDSFDSDGEDGEDGENHSSPDEDIRKLTESTIKMSGLDDFQWSVNETARRDEAEQGASSHEDEGPSSHFTIQPPGEEFAVPDKGEPSLEPHPNMMDTGGSSFEVPLFARESAPPLPTARGKAPARPESTDISAKSVYEHAPEMDEPEPPFQMSGSGFPADDLSVSEFDDFGSQDFSAGPSAEPDDERKESEAVAITHDQIEHIVRQQVQERLQEIARKMLPDIAERIIKEEIHRMLSNPP